MNEKWIPVIDRKRENQFPADVLSFFHDILTNVENDEKSGGTCDWRVLNSLKDKLIIESDTKKHKIQIPAEIKFGSIYFREENSKTWNFIKNLRHAYAHNYILLDDNLVKIALPAKYNKGIKLVCYLNFHDLKEVVTTLTSLTYPIKKKQK